MDDIILCSGCDGTIGIVVIAGGRVRLKVGLLLLDSVRGRCSTCNTEYHWTASDSLPIDSAKRKRYNHN